MGEPEGHRHVCTDSAGLIKQRVVDERPRRGQRERPEGNAQAKDQPGQARPRPPRPLLTGDQAHDQERRGGRRGPELDRDGEPERYAGPGQPTGPGEPAMAECGVHSDQAAQVHPGLEQQVVATRHIGGIDGKEAAGHRRCDGPAVTHQVPGQGHARGTGAHGENSREPECRRRREDPPDERHRRHEQQDARRLHKGVIPVGQRPLGQPDGRAEVYPVVVFGHARQQPRPGEDEQPDAEGKRRRHDHRHARRGKPVGPHPRSGQPAGAAAVLSGGVHAFGPAGNTVVPARERGLSSHVFALPYEVAGRT